MWNVLAAGFQDRILAGMNDCVFVWNGSHLHPHKLKVFFEWIMNLSWGKGTPHSLHMAWVGSEGRFSNALSSFIHRNSGAELSGRKMWKRIPKRNHTLCTLGVICTEKVNSCAQIFSVVLIITPLFFSPSQPLLPTSMSVSHVLCGCHHPDFQWTFSEKSSFLIWLIHVCRYVQLLWQLTSCTQKTTYTFHACIQSQGY